MEPEYVGIDIGYHKISISYWKGYSATEPCVNQGKFLSITGYSDRVWYRAEDCEHIAKHDPQHFYEGFKELIGSPNVGDNRPSNEVMLGIILKKDLELCKIKSGASVVASVPYTYSLKQRRALYDILEATGLKEPFIIDDITALAFQYMTSYYNHLSFGPHTIPTVASIILDIGQTSARVHAVSCVGKLCTILCSSQVNEYDTRMIDDTLITKIIGKCEGITADDSLRRWLSMNLPKLKKLFCRDIKFAPITVELGISSSQVVQVTREEFDSVISEYIEEIKRTIEDVREKAEERIRTGTNTRVSVDTIMFFGSMTRLSIFKKLPEQLGMKLLDRLERESEISRGCCLVAKKLFSPENEEDGSLDLYTVDRWLEPKVFELNEVKYPTEAQLVLAGSFPTAHVTDGPDLQIKWNGETLTELKLSKKEADVRMVLDGLYYNGHPPENNYVVEVKKCGEGYLYMGDDSHIDLLKRNSDSVKQIRETINKLLFDEEYLRLKDTLQYFQIENEFITSLKNSLEKAQTLSDLEEIRRKLWNK